MHLGKAACTCLSAEQPLAFIHLLFCRTHAWSSWQTHSGKQLVPVNTTQPSEAKQALRKSQIKTSVLFCQ